MRTPQNSPLITAVQAPIYETAVHKKKANSTGHGNFDSSARAREPYLKFFPFTKSTVHNSIFSSFTADNEKYGIIYWPQINNEKKSIFGESHQSVRLGGKKNKKKI